MLMGLPAAVLGGVRLGCTMVRSMLGGVTVMLTEATLLASLLSGTWLRWSATKSTK